jgi:hypothetical protein
MRILVGNFNIKVGKEDTFKRQLRKKVYMRLVPVMGFDE